MVVVDSKLLPQLPWRVKIGRNHVLIRGETLQTVDLPWPLRVSPMPRTVLIVDDERDTNDIMASLVRARDFEPIQLFSGAQVGPAVSEQKPALILLDLML